MIGKMSHVMMWAKDLDKVARWYKEKLEFQITYHAPGEFLSLHHDGMGRLDFHAAGDETGQIGKGPLPYFSTPDLAKALAWLESRGVKVGHVEQVADSPKHSWFWDCEGNTIGIEEV